MTALAQEAAGEKAWIPGRTNDAAPRLLTTSEDMVQAAKEVVRSAGRRLRATVPLHSSFPPSAIPAELRKALPDAVVVGIGKKVFHEAARDGRSFAIVTITRIPR